MFMMFLLYGMTFAFAALALVYVTFFDRKNKHRVGGSVIAFPSAFLATIGLILISVAMFTAAFNHKLFGDKVGLVQILATFVFAVLPFFGVSLYFSLKTRPDSPSLELVKSVLFVSATSLVCFGVVFHSLVTYHINKFHSYPQSEHKVYNVKENGEWSDKYLKVASNIENHKIVNGCYVSTGAEVQPGDLVYLSVADAGVFATLGQDYKTLTELDYKLPSGEVRSVELLSFNLKDFTECLTIEE